MQLKAGILGVGAIILITLFFSTYYTVAPYERAVLTRFGQFVSVEGEGLHFKVPFVNSVTFYRTDIEEIKPKEAANTYTIDNQEVDILWKVFYRVPAANIEFIYRNVQDYKPRLESITIDRLKAEMGKVNVQHVAEKRGDIRDTIKRVLVQDAKSIGLEVVDFQLPNVEYTKSFRLAVEQAASAKAGVETREQELEQAKKTAERVRVEARGKADAYLFEQESIAKGIELKGRAEAAAIEAQAKALAANATLTELRKAERWDGKLPTSMLSNVVPFMSVDQQSTPIKIAR